MRIAVTIDPEYLAEVLREEVNPSVLDTVERLTGTVLPDGLRVNSPTSVSFNAEALVGCLHAE